MKLHIIESENLADMSICNMRAQSMVFEQIVAGFSEKEAHIGCVRKSDELKNLDSKGSLLLVQSGSCLDGNFIDIIKESFECFIPIIFTNPQKEERELIDSLLSTTFYQTKSEIAVFVMQRENTSMTCTYIQDLERDFEVECTGYFDNLWNWINYVSRPNPEFLINENNKKIESEEIPNLVKLAHSYLDTFIYVEDSKVMSSSFFSVACHTFDSNGGNDWYYIEQQCILDGSADYAKFWGKTRVIVEGGSWYVGQGECCRYYMNYYQMDNFLSPTPSLGSDVMLINTSPSAFNNTSTNTTSTGYDIGFGVGASYASIAGTTGNAGLSFGVSFTSSQSVNVLDCTLSNYSEPATTKTSWKYNFKHAEHKPNHSQTLIPPALLSYTTFTPINEWMWKIPSKMRNVYGKFCATYTLNRISTITRYSGSQSPKDIAGAVHTKTFEVPLHQPPTYGCDKKILTFSDSYLIDKFNICSQENWTLKVDQDWVSCNTNDGKSCTPETVVVSVTKNTTQKQRTAMLTINTGVNSIKINIVQA